MDSLAAPLLVLFSTANRGKTDGMVARGLEPTDVHVGGDALHVAGARWDQTFVLVHSTEIRWFVPKSFKKFSDPLPRGGVLHRDSSKHGQAAMRPDQSGHRQH
jgi:hypothetical protein